MSAPFSAAFSAAAGTSCVVDVADLDFIDIGGMRAIATAALQSGTPVRLCNAPPILRRAWQLGGFASVAPDVELVA